MTLKSLSVEDLREMTENGGSWCGGIEVVVGGGGVVCITLHWESAK